MKRDNVRSIMLFVIVTLVLGAIVIGGVRIAKGRDAAYAIQHRPLTKQQNVVSTPTRPSPSPTSVPQQVKTSQQPTLQSPTQSTPAQQQASSTSVVPASDPVPTNNPTNSSQLPSTGFSIYNLITIGFVMAAIYFGLLLKQTRTAYKRLLSKDA